MRSLSASISHRSLHFLLKSDKPVFNIAFSLNTFNELNCLLLTLELLRNINDQFSVGLIEGYAINGIEEILEIILDGIWIRSNRQDLKQELVRAEIETWENISLRLQIVLKGFLANLKTLLQSTERVLKDIISAAANDILLFSSSLHDLQPLLVNTLELLAHRWHLFGDITRCEHGYEVGP